MSAILRDPPPRTSPPPRSSPPPNAKEQRVVSSPSPPPPLFPSPIGVRLGLSNSSLSGSCAPSSSSLSAHLAFMQSLAAVPESLMRPRSRAERHVPIMTKEHSQVYRDEENKSAHGYLLHPNYRDLIDSDPATISSHPSLRTILSLPPSLVPARPAAVVPAPKAGSAAALAAAAVRPSAKIFLVRKPRRGAAVEAARAERLEREQDELWEAAGMRPRLVQPKASTKDDADDEKSDVVRDPSSHPSLRIDHIPSGGDDIAPHSPSSVRTDIGDAWIGGVGGGNDDMAGYDSALLMHAQQSAPISPRSAMRATRALDYCAGNPRPLIPCNICHTTKLIDPLSSLCNHYACSDCWMMRLMDEEQKTCIECNATVGLEELKRMDGCELCARIPVQSYTGVCGHTCCTQCWRRWIITEAKDTCCECEEMMDVAELPELE